MPALRKFSLLLAIAALLFVTACGGGNATSGTPSNDGGQQENKSQAGKASPVLSIGTTPAGVSYNTIATGIAKVLSSTSDLKVTVKPTNGLSAWGPQLNKGDIQLGVASGPDLAWAFRGQNGYERTENLRLLVTGNYILNPGMAVRKDSDIQKIADLKGRLVTAEYPGSIISKMLVEAVLAVNGLSWDDVKKVPVPTTADGIKAIQDDRVEAAFPLVPQTPIIQEVHNAVGLRAIPFLDDYTPQQFDQIPQELKDKLNEIVPGVEYTVISAEGYIAEDMVGIKYPTQMVASAHLDDDTVYKIMETLWANYEQLAPIHVWLESWTPDNFFNPNPTLPYHPGAVKFYKDKGLWNDEVEAKQQALLAEAK